MKLPHRRQVLHLAAGAAALPAVSRFAWAQAYPSRPVRLIVGFPAGGPTDILNDDGLAKRRPHALGQDATDHVRKSARGEWHDHRDRT